MEGTAVAVIVCFRRGRPRRALDEPVPLLPVGRSFAANVRSLNGQNEQLRALLEQIVDMPGR